MLKKCLAGRNISMIGMPGSGKTTVSKLLANRYNLSFVDTDIRIAETEGMTIDEIFSQYGEEKFRDMETECIRRVSTLKSVVISTGGGVVLREENMYFLKKNSFVIFIDRSPEDILKDIDAEKRPLLKKQPNRIFELYNSRIELYSRYADCVVKNNGDLSEVMEDIDQRMMDILALL
jgi:shikimate kinase